MTISKPVEKSIPGINQETAKEAEYSATLNQKNYLKALGKALVESLKLTAEVETNKEPRETKTVKEITAGKVNYTGSKESEEMWKKPSTEYHAAAYVYPFVMLTNTKAYKAWADEQMKSDIYKENPMVARLAKHKYDKNHWDVDNPEELFTDANMQWLKGAIESQAGFQDKSDETKEAKETRDAAQGTGPILKNYTATDLVTIFWEKTKQNNKTRENLIKKHAIRKLTDSIGINRAYVEQANMGDKINLILPEKNKSKDETPETPEAAKLWWQGVKNDQYLLLSGPSGTAFRVLLLFKDLIENKSSQWKEWFDQKKIEEEIKKAEGQEFLTMMALLFLAGYLPPLNHHSYYEIMTAAKGIIDWNEKTPYVWLDDTIAKFDKKYGVNK